MESQSWHITKVIDNEIVIIRKKKIRPVYVYLKLDKLDYPNDNLSKSNDRSKLFFSVFALENILVSLTSQLEMALVSCIQNCSA